MNTITLEIIPNTLRTHFLFLSLLLDHKVIFHVSQVANLINTCPDLETLDRLWTDLLSIEC